MNPLRQKMIDAMLLRGFSPRTHQSYLTAIADLSKYYRRSPETLSIVELQQYILYLVKEKQLAPASCSLCRNAMRFLYCQVLGWDEFNVAITIPRKPQRIPELLTQNDIRHILASVDNKKHHMLLTTCYGCGLRVSELVNIKVRDIDGARRLLRVVQGKGSKDRQVLLSETLLRQLREYWQDFRPTHWLFYSTTKDKSLSISSAQKAFLDAKRRARIEKVGGIHSLRHAYATHQLDAGMAIHTLQQQLGHQDLHSTMRYLHWVPQHQPGKGTDLLQTLGVSHG